MKLSEYLSHPESVMVNSHSDPKVRKEILERSLVHLKVTGMATPGEVKKILSRIDKEYPDQ